MAVMLVATLAVIDRFAEGALVQSTVSRLELEAGLLTAGAGGRNGVTATDLAAGDLALVLGGDATAVTILDETGATVAADANGAPETVSGARLAASDYRSVLASGASLSRVLTETDGSGRILVVAAPVDIRQTGAGGGSGRPAEKGPPPGRGLGNQKAASSAAPVVDANPNAIAQLSVSLAPVDATLSDLRSRLLAAGCVIVVAGIALAWALTTLGLRPLGRVARAADQVAAGDLSVRARLADGDDEIARLGRAFDGMVDRVESTLVSQRQFAADASHELRSPLTVLGGYVDVLGRGPLADSETGQRALAAMRREIDRLTRLASDLLLLTQLEAGGAWADRQGVDLGEIVEGVGEATAIRAPTRRIEVVRSTAVPVRADPDRLMQALMNLVDNALRYASPESPITLAADRDGDTAIASVANAGDPIPAEALPHLFERFYRVGGGRHDHEAVPHAGLGLSIVRAIATAFGGSVTVSSDERLTRFEIRLPLADADRTAAPDWVDAPAAVPDHPGRSTV